MKPARIMIVEDDIIVAYDISTIFQDLGYVITAVVVSGAEAINQALADRPDLILMDIHLNGVMDGIDTAVAIRQRLTMPVVFMTAFGDSEKIERAKAVVPLAYLLKPVQEEVLRITVEMALEVGRSQKELRRELEINRVLAMVSTALVADEFDMTDVSRLVLENVRQLTGSRAGLAITDESAAGKPPLTVESGLTEADGQWRATLTDLLSIAAAQPAWWQRILAKRQPFYSADIDSLSSDEGGGAANDLPPNLLLQPVFVQERLAELLILIDVEGGFSATDLQLVG